MGNSVIEWLGFLAVRAPMGAVIVLLAGEEDQGTILAFSNLIPDVLELFKRDYHVLHN